MIYVLDTNVVSDFLKRHSQVSEAIFRATGRNDRLLIPQPVHYELVRSLIRHNATGQLKRLTDEILPQLEWIALSDDDWMQAGRFWAVMVSTGRQLSDVDLLLAALTQRLDATLVTADDDFDVLPIKRVN